MAGDWNARLYDASHGFVWEFGRDLLAMLAPQAGERILDVGCGTGHLTAEIAAAGARVHGCGPLGGDDRAGARQLSRARFRYAGCL